MKKTKRFDCVRMKNEIQAKMLRDYAGLSDDERQTAMEHELTVSNSPVARLWRQVTQKHEPAMVAEAPAKHTARPRK